MVYYASRILTLKNVIVISVFWRIKQDYTKGVIVSEKLAALFVLVVHQSVRQPKKADTQVAKHDKSRKNREMGFKGSSVRFKACLHSRVYRTMHLHLKAPYRRF